MRCRIVGRLATLTAVVFTLAAASALAQPRRGGGMGTPRYDKTTETTLSGTVSDVQSQQGRGGGSGTHVILATSSGPVDVHLGPTTWLEGKKFTFAKGDRLEVVGSKVTVDGTEAVIAREVKRGENTMVLRNENGVPLWSRGRRGLP